MKKIVLLLACIFTFSISFAEDVIQVKPIKTQAGVVSEDEKSFSLIMSNEKDFKALTFNIYLPEGITLDPDFLFSYGPAIPVVTDRSGSNRQHNADVKDKGNGCYSVSLVPIVGAKDPILKSAAVGSLLEFYYITSPDIKPGIYPIVITNLVMGQNGTEGIVFDRPIVSFVTIEGAEGANSILDLQDYIVPSFVEEALPTSNVIKNGVCENLVITDKVPFYNSKEFVAKKASYTREATGYNWGTICLPFEIYSNDDLSLQALQSISGNTMEFAEVPSTLAYAPYAYCTPEPTALNISVENVTVPEYVDGTYGFAPIVMKSVMKEAVTLETGSNAYYIANDQFWTPTVNPVNVAPMRAYYDIEGAGVKCFGIEGVSTAINGTEAGANIEGVYNANGAAQNGMKKGVNLVKYSDGTTQKIIIK